MRLGLFGGTFDPVHYGHLLLAECCHEQCKLNEVRFLPAAVPPHKQDWEPAPAEARIEMLELAIAGQPAFSVSRYETDRGGVNYTVDTLAHFRQECPEAELFLLLGADMLYDLPNWRQPERVCQLATPVVVDRPGTEQLAAAGRLNFTYQQVEMPRIGISSTDIRRRVAAGLSIRYQTPRAVEKYIEMHRLYGDKGNCKLQIDN